MTAGTDAVLALTPAGYYDMQIGPDGDILTAEFWDTAILYSLFGERRADPDEMVQPERRRGWIGNSQFDPPFENGSKLWLLDQARITRTTLNRLQDEAAKGLQWFVDDGLAVSVDTPVATFQQGRVVLDVTIRRSRDQVIRRFFTLWENTGRAS